MMIVKKKVVGKQSGFPTIQQVRKEWKRHRTQPTIKQIEILEYISVGSGRF